MERHITFTLIANEFIVRHSIMAHIMGIGEELGNAGAIRPKWREVATHFDVGPLRCQHLLTWLEQELWFLPGDLQGPWVEHMPVLSCLRRRRRSKVPKAV